MRNPRSAGRLSTRSAGAAGEDRASAWLQERGWLIRERNYRGSGAEVDIIAEKDGQVAFVEVKAWKSFPASELEFSIDARKQNRIARAARSWLSARREPAERRLRFDVIFLGDDDRPVRHIEGAFSGGID
jgi:putative endonuclease